MSDGDDAPTFPAGRTIGPDRDSKKTESSAQMVSLCLNDRSLVAVGGPDAQPLLQGILTTDLDTLPAGEASAGALLTPQGKILFDFLISRSGEDGFLIEMDRTGIEAFARRLTLYKLRARVEIAAVDDAQVTVGWGEAAEGLKDTRFRAGTEVRRSYDGRGAGASEAAREDYDRLRIASAVAESGHDFALSDVFPSDVLMDLNGGVSYRKGCFVGQEVVSRMHHRKSARKRIAVADADRALPASGTALEAAGRSVGTLGTVVGERALALVRTDRVAEALAAGTAVTAGDTAVKLSFPDWTGLGFDAPAAAERG